MSRLRVFYTAVLVTIFVTTDLAIADIHNLFTWFRGGESTVPGVHDHLATLPGPLAEFVYSRIGTGDPRWHLGRDDFIKCYGDLTPDGYEYRLELTNDGIRFLVPLTSNGSCGEEIRATFKELAPFMNKQGLRYAAQIQKRRNKQ